MEEKYEVHLLEPLAEGRRFEVAQTLSEGFRISPEKMARVLAFVGIITKPLSKELADKVAESLTQVGAKIMVLRQNLAEALILDEELPEAIVDATIVDKESLREFLADIPSPPMYVVPPYIPVVSESLPITQPVVWGVFSLLFLILTLTFGVSFTHLPDLEPVQAQRVIESIQPKHEVMPVNFAKLHEVVD